MSVLLKESAIYEVEGKAIRVDIEVSEDRKHVEYNLEGSAPLSLLEVACVLEVLCSNAMKHVKVTRPVWAEELH